MPLIFFFVHSFNEEDAIVGSSPDIRFYNYQIVRESPLTGEYYHPKKHGSDKQHELEHHPHGPSYKHHHHQHHHHQPHDVKVEPKHDEPQPHSDIHPSEPQPKPIHKDDEKTHPQVEHADTIKPGTDGGKKQKLRYNFNPLENDDDDALVAQVKTVF